MTRATLRAVEPAVAEPRAPDPFRERQLAAVERATLEQASFAAERICSRMSMAKMALRTASAADPAAKTAALTRALEHLRSASADLTSVLGVIGQ